MNLLHDIGIGFDVAFAVRNLLAALLGTVLGVLAGVLPGIGPVAAMALLVPALAGLDATPSLILLAAVYYGAQYGASTTAILLRPSSAPPFAVASDGGQMARQGRAGAALSAATLGSFLAGCAGALVIALLALPLAELAFRFGPAEYFSLIVLGLVGAAAFASGSFAKGLAMTLLGLLLAQVSSDGGAGAPRFAFEIEPLSGGIGFVVLALGLFGASEAISRLDGAAAASRELVTAELRHLWPAAHDLRDAWPAMLRGTALGAALGLLPGHGASLASFLSYAVEKKVAGEPRVPFGRGAIEGVAGPESANSAATLTSFVPMLAFGIPANAAMALLVGVLTLKGLHAGPQLLTAQPQLFWGLIASMWFGNLMLVLLSLPLAGLWIRLLRVPYGVVFPAVILLCCVGAYALGHRTFDIYLTAVVAFAGYGFLKLGCDTAPLLLGFVMEPVLEEHLRSALRLSGGDWKTLAARPLSFGLLVAAALVIVVVTLPSIRRQRERALQED